MLKRIIEETKKIVTHDSSFQQQTVKDDNVDEIFVKKLRMITNRDKRSIFKARSCIVMIKCNFPTSVSFVNSTKIPSETK